MPAINLRRFAQLKATGEKIACLTAYDGSFAKLLSKSGIELLLIGDTLGNVIQGHATTVPVTLEQMVYHTACVARGNEGAFLLGDLPFMTYATPIQAIDSATQIMQAGAHMVKMEGGAWLTETIRTLTQCGIPVCGHLGLTPQSVHQLGGYRIQGRDALAATKLSEEALRLQEAGASLLILECIPTDLAGTITAQLQIPTIGIGAGPLCDGQMLVLYDLLGLNPENKFRFTKIFLDGVENKTLQDAVSAYIRAVKQKDFPELSHSY